MPSLSEFHRKTSQKYISFFSKQTLTRYNKRSKVPFLLEAGLRVLLFFVLSRFYNAGRFTSQVRSLINITDTSIYDAISMPVLEVSYDEIISSRVYFTLHLCLIFSEMFAITLPSIIAEWVYVRFIANIGELESSRS